MTSVTYGNARLALSVFLDWVKDEFSSRLGNAFSRYSTASAELCELYSEIEFVRDQLVRFQSQSESWFLESTGLSKEETITLHSQYLESLENRAEETYSEECQYKLLCDVYYEVTQCSYTAWKLYMNLAEEEERASV